jgi:S1-C subfamily serine protease
MAIGNPFNLGAQPFSVGIISRPFERSLSPSSEGRSRAAGSSQDGMRATITPANSARFPLLHHMRRAKQLSCIDNRDQLSGNSQHRPAARGWWDTSRHRRFAIPINVARELLPQLRAGKITRGRIGVGIARSLPTRERVRPEGSERGGGWRTWCRAARPTKAGLEPGDVIIAYNGKPIRNATNWSRWSRLPSRRAQTCPCASLREQAEKTLNVTVRGARSSRSGEHQRPSG